MGGDVVKTLIGVCAFTGCDSLNAFGGKAKYFHWTLFYTMNDLEKRKIKSEEGKNCYMRPKLFRELCRFMGFIYFGHSTTESTNDLWYHWYLQKKEENILGSSLHAKICFLPTCYQAKMPNKLAGSFRSTKLWMLHWKSCSPLHVDVWNTCCWSRPKVHRMQMWEEVYHEVPVHDLSTEMHCSLYASEL